MKYDYLIVGAGLFGAVFAHEAKKAGKKKTVTITAASTDGTNKKAKVRIKIK